MSPGGHHTEHWLRGEVRSLLRSLEREGAPLYAFKVHGSQFQERGVHDWVGCAAGRFFTVETKRPGMSRPRYDVAQERHASRIAAAGGLSLLATDTAQVRDFLRTLLGGGGSYRSLR